MITMTSNHLNKKQKISILNSIYNEQGDVYKQLTHDLFVQFITESPDAMHQLLELEIKRQNTHKWDAFSCHDLVGHIISFFYKNVFVLIRLNKYWNKVLMKRPSLWTSYFDPIDLIQSEYGYYNFEPSSKHLFPKVNITMNTDPCHDTWFQYIKCYSHMKEVLLDINNSTEIGATSIEQEYALCQFKKLNDSLPITCLITVYVTSITFRDFDFQILQCFRSIHFLNLWHICAVDIENINCQEYWTQAFQTNCKDLKSLILDLKSHDFYFTLLQTSACQLEMLEITIRLKAYQNIDLYLSYFKIIQDMKQLKKITIKNINDSESIESKTHFNLFCFLPVSIEEINFNRYLDHEMFHKMHEITFKFEQLKVLKIFFYDPAHTLLIPTLFPNVEDIELCHEIKDSHLILPLQHLPHLKCLILHSANRNIYKSPIPQQFDNTCHFHGCNTKNDLQLFFNSLLI